LKYGVSVSPLSAVIVNAESVVSGVRMPHLRA
jgi:hypothetical protein